MAFAYLATRTEIHAIQQDLKDFLRYYYQTTIVQQTENYLIVLLGNYLHKQPEATISKEYFKPQTIRTI